MAAQKESLFKARVLKDLATYKGCWFTKIQQVAIRGTPDIIGCMRGRFIALELKASPKSKIEELQKYTLEKIEAAGGFSAVAYPENWIEIQGILDIIYNEGKT